MTVLPSWRRPRRAAAGSTATADDALGVENASESFVRTRLAPDGHRPRGDLGQHELRVPCDAGDIRFIEIIGAAWVCGSTYRHEAAEPDQGSERVRTVHVAGDLG